jgi:hypothetical protein
MRVLSGCKVLGEVMIYWDVTPIIWRNGLNLARRGLILRFVIPLEYSSSKGLPGVGISFQSSIKMRLGKI